MSFVDTTAKQKRVKDKSKAQLVRILQGVQMRTEHHYYNYQSRSKAEDLGARGCSPMIKDNI